jgi:DNA-binding NtrC family response regulator
MASVDGALESIGARRPSIAILDINLGNRNSFAITDMLHELDIPFIFAAGYGEQAQLPMHHRGSIVVQKPYTLENVARALDDVLQYRASVTPTPAD